MDTLLNFDTEETIGEVMSVDTGMAIAIIKRDDMLSKLQVNQLLAIKSPHSGRHIIGMIVKIFRKALAETFGIEDEDDDMVSNLNQIRIVFIGEFLDNDGEKKNTFKRNICAVPFIGALCYKLEGERLTNLMKSISSNSAKVKNPLIIGKYTMDDTSVAYLDGDKLFQRHAAIVGSTGSGKSYCVARIVEQMAELKYANAILFDIHGEYSTDSFSKEGITHYRIANPADLLMKDKLNDGIIMLPYWLLNYEEMQALLLDRSDQNAPNQAMLLSKEIFAAKDRTVQDGEYKDKLTVDSPIPYKLTDVLSILKDLDTDMVKGTKGDKQGPF